MTLTPQGFRTAVTCAGLREVDRPDMALIASDRPCQAAGVFTTNQVKAAAVLYDQRILENPSATVRAVLVNTGSANACTGDPGLADARASAVHAAERLGCAPDEVLLLSTGVIGLPLPMDRIRAGIEALAGSLDTPDWPRTAAAIMTTDTRPKFASARLPSGAAITGIAKGAGMIAPHMATMLSVVTTDAVLAPGVLARALAAAAGTSFNRIVVDGDMSTNDTVLALANGASSIMEGEAAFTAALTDVCAQLAQAIVRDGEGATKFVTLHVTGAASEFDARAVAQTIATSPLVKTAFYGADANWGRVLAAAGRAGVDFDATRAALWLWEDEAQPIQLVAAGQPTAYDEPAAIALMRGDAWHVRLDLGAGDAATWVWTCDLSHEYVTINSHYRT